MEQWTVPIEVAIVIMSTEVIFLGVWIKLLQVFKNFELFTVKKVSKKPKEKILHTDNYPFGEGEPLDWYGLEYWNKVD